MILMVISTNNETNTTAIDKDNNNWNNINTGYNGNADKNKKRRTGKKNTSKSLSSLFKCYLLTWTPAWPYTYITDIS